MPKSANSRIKFQCSGHGTTTSSATIAGAVSLASDGSWPLDTAFVRFHNLGLPSSKLESMIWDRQRNLSRLSTLRAHTFTNCIPSEWFQKPVWVQCINCDFIRNNRQNFFALFCTQFFTSNLCENTAKNNCYKMKMFIWNFEISCSEPVVAPHDIALLKLETPLKFNSRVAPIKLPEAGAEPVGNVKLSGWGSISTTEIPNLPNILQKATVPIVDRRTCNATINAIIGGNSKLHSTNICTGPLNGGLGACSVSSFEY